MPTKEDRRIEDLGIYELRVLARQVGVQSPTSKKREELLVAIRSILEGKENPYTKKDGRGRPTKAVSSIDEFSNVLVPSNLNYDIKGEEDRYIFAQDVDKSFSIMQNYMPYHTSQDKERTNVSGIVDKNRMGVSILRVKMYDYSEEDIFISNAFTNDGRLQVGDYVEGVAVRTDKDKPRSLSSINCINGVAYDKYEVSRPQIVNTAKKVYHIKGKQILAGKRTLILFEGRQNLAEKGIEIYENLQEKNTHVFHICLNHLDADSMFETDTYHYIPVSFVSDDVSKVLATKLVFHRANTLAMRGENVLIVFSSLSHYLKSVMNDEQKIDVLEKKAVRDLKEYLSYSRCYDNGGSLTILCLENTGINEQLKKVVDYELIDIFHQVDEITL